MSLNFGCFLLVAFWVKSVITIIITIFNVLSFCLPLCLSVSLPLSAGVGRGVWAVVAERSVCGRVTLWRQLSLCHTWLPGLVRVRGHSQHISLPSVQKAQLPPLQGIHGNEMTFFFNCSFIYLFIFNTGHEVDFPPSIPHSSLLGHSWRDELQTVPGWFGSPGH